MKITCITLSSEMECNQYMTPSGRIYFFWHGRFTEVSDAEDVEFFLRQKLRFVPEKEIIPETPETAYDNVKGDKNETATEKAEVEMGAEESHDVRTIDDKEIMLDDYLGRNTAVVTKNIKTDNLGKGTLETLLDREKNGKHRKAILKAIEEKLK